MQLIESVIIFSIIWGLFVLMLVINFSIVPDFKRKLPLYWKKINGKKFGFLTLKIIGFLTLLYFVGGVEFDIGRFSDIILLFSGIMVYIMMRALVDVREKIEVPDFTIKEIRMQKLLKIKSRNLIYKIKKIF